MMKNPLTEHIVQETHQLGPLLPQLAVLSEEERTFLSIIRFNYMSSRGFAKKRNNEGVCAFLHPMRTPREDAEKSEQRLRDLVTHQWSQQPHGILLGNRNLPPLINARGVDPHTTFILNLVTDICPNVGGVFYILGSLAFHPAVGEGERQTVASFLFASGSLFFLIGSCANFIKNNAIAGDDVALSVNAAMYIVANALYLAGSFSFLPAAKDALGGNYLGLIFFTVASLMFVIAPSYDLYRAHHLRSKLQISRLSYCIELAITAMYIGGSVLFLIGSILYLPFIALMKIAGTFYLISSCCFLGANIMSPLANFWRYVYRVTRVEKTTLISDIAQRSGQSPDDVMLGNRNLPPLVNDKVLDPRLKKKLTRFTTFCGNIGSVFYVIGSFLFYPQFSNPLMASLMYLCGGLVFLAGSSTNFYKNDAASWEDFGLSFNASMYIVANIMGICSSICFIPFVQGYIGGNYAGIGFTMMASVIFIVAPSYDMHRARKLRSNVRISYLSFVIEMTVAGLYIGGSYFFVVGCIFFFPELSRSFAVDLFVIGSFCFLGANLSSPVADSWRYVIRRLVKNRVISATNNKVIDAIPEPSLYNSDYGSISFLNMSLSEMSEFPSIHTIHTGDLEFLLGSKAYLSDSQGKQPIATATHSRKIKKVSFGRTGSKASNPLTAPLRMDLEKGIFGDDDDDYVNSIRMSQFPHAGRFSEGKELTNKKLNSYKRDLSMSSLYSTALFGDIDISYSTNFL